MVVIKADINDRESAKYDKFDGHLPHELTLEILLRLPAKSLLRFKLVSKSWNSLISRQDFKKSHTRNSKPQPVTLLYNSYYMPVNSLSLSKSDSLNPTVLQVNLSFHDGGKRYMCSELIGSCNGLICTYSEFEKCFYLRNPLTKETKEIYFPYHKSDTFLRIRSGGASWFGSVPSMNDYVIWVPVNRRVYLYSIRDDKWRELDTSDIESFGSVHWGNNVVVMNETLHCLLDNYGRKFMVRYDLVQETFEVARISFNYHNYASMKFNTELSIGILQDSNSNLSICMSNIYYSRNNNRRWVMDVWKLEKYNKLDSWKKLFSLDLESSPDSPYCQFYSFLLGFTSNRGILVKSSLFYEDHTTNFNELFLFDLNQNSLRRMQLGRVEDVSYMLDYVETLVSPFSLP
ncbi:F-box/kelch-repeat protein At3g23880-like [Spinacia oleracea]|uniref:F-box/kelch-repeat protein At3g23880-like n=1 Tax=Spinacia oleracea TaxID=3562 RepID=A0ABM3R1I6_SPIOL|nr:F-box/kelch-repeat protein At3g23880-like [Spinacia oleracea]